MLTSLQPTGKDDTEMVGEALHLSARVDLGAGTFGITTALVAALQRYPTIRISGAGMFNTSLRLDAPSVGYNGLLGYGLAGQHPVIAQLILSDLTLDGNYEGIAGGALPMQNSGALVSLPWPQRTINDSASDLFHEFRRVRFYRPAAYVFQPTLGCLLDACVFDHCGQPDQPPDGDHKDNLGSGAGNATVTRTLWKDSSGNYADFVGANPGDLVRLIFQTNESRNHQLGGIYACGDGGVVTGNRLQNMNPGSGIGYDAGTLEANRRKNVVTSNSLVNLPVDQSGLSTKYGDVVAANTVA